MAIPDIDIGLVGQLAISDEIEKIHASAQVDETQPRLDFPPYRSAILRHPTRDAWHTDPEGAELFAPVFGHADVDVLESDLTIGGAGEPIGERILVRARVLDGDGRPVRRQLAEIWQANAAGRYVHRRDQHSHHNAWRPAHIHFSLFGTEFTQRMITQMYFPGDPLFALDRIYHCWFSTVEPGPARPGGAPFFAVAVFARGLLNRLFTRIYLPVDDAALAADSLRCLPWMPPSAAAWSPCVKPMAACGSTSTYRDRGRPRS